MNKHILLFTILATTSGLIAITDADAKKQGADILKNIMTSYGKAFAGANIFTAPSDLSMWNAAISQMRTFVTTVINDTKSWLGQRDSTLTNALDKIIRVDIDVINNIKITRGVWPLDAIAKFKHRAIFDKLREEIYNVENSLKSSMSPVAKDEARKLLLSAAMFIGKTASKAAIDSLKR